MSRRIILLLSIILVSGCSRFEIIERPIEFGAERKKLTLEYLKERYGIHQIIPTINPRMVVVHWTQIPTLEKSFEAFSSSTLPDSRPEIAGAGSLNVSAHYLVDRDGTVYHLMPDTLMARHVIGLNHCAIGIENVGGTGDTPLTDEQLESNIRLIKKLDDIYELEYMIGHYEYTRFEDHPLWKEIDEGYRTVKTDPGEKFMISLRQALQDRGFKDLPQ